MTATLDTFVVPTPDEIRDSILRTIRNGLIVRGVANPNVTKDSDHWVRAQAIANELAIIYANTTVKADQVLPDTATGEDLARHLNIYFGSGFLPATGSSGNIVYDASATGPVLVGAQLIDDAGNVFEVTTGGSYADGASIPIRSTSDSLGSGTVHVENDVLQWVSAPPYSAATALVGAGGLTGGKDAETDEPARNRLYDRLRNPGGGGNWSQVNAWCAEGSASVDAAYCYPAFDGPSTLGACVLGELTWTLAAGFTRETTEAVRAAVESYLKAQFPEHAQITVQTPTVAASASVAVSASIGLDLPASTAAAGPGGGWVDAVPWPVLTSAATRCTVSVATDSTHLTLTSDDATNCPSSTNLLAGVTKISWFSPSLWNDGQDCIVTATITSSAGTTGAITVVLDTPFTGIAVGDYVFPACENAEAYANAYIAAIANLGPAQWTTDSARLANGRALRHPLTTKQNPSDLTSTTLRAITDVGDEVADVCWLYRTATTPGVPANTTLSPKVFVPYRFGFYDKIA